jgi:hypothetical protein
VTANTHQQGPSSGAAVSGWKDITICLMHYVPRSKGARVVVMAGDRHIVSSASYEGMTVDDPEIQSFLTWAKDYYHGAAFRNIAKEQALALEAESVTPVKRRRGRPSKTPSNAERTPSAGS